MINQIYFDLDNCIAIANLFNQNSKDDLDYDFGFALENEIYGNEIYQVKINPCAWNLISYARCLVGSGNVFILTSSAKDYANRINELALFRFPENQIIAREELDKTIWNMKFCPDYVNTYKNKDNILIDNLFPQENKDKMAFLGISLDNYLKVEDYYGHRIEDFEDKVIKFLKEKYETLS